MIRQISITVVAGLALVCIWQIDTTKIDFWRFMAGFVAMLTILEFKK